MPSTFSSSTAGSPLTFKLPQDLKLDAMKNLEMFGMLCWSCKCLLSLSCFAFNLEAPLSHRFNFFLLSCLFICHLSSVCACERVRVCVYVCVCTSHRLYIKEVRMSPSSSPGHKRQNNQSYIFFANKSGRL